MERFRNRMSTVLLERAERRALRRARRWAADVLACTHPYWHQALFDEAFVVRLPAKDLLRLSPADLARQWSCQFNYSDERRREHDIKRLTPVAEFYQELMASAATDFREGRRPSYRPLGVASGSYPVARSTDQCGTVSTVKPGPGAAGSLCSDA